MFGRRGHPERMKSNLNRLRELAALDALGVLEGDGAAEFSRLLREDKSARREAIAFQAVTEAMAKSLPSPPPSPGLKGKIIEAAKRSQTRAKVEQVLKELAPKAEGGFAFVHDALGTGWVPLSVPGAFVKVLSYDDTNGYATVLGKLEAGARYPAHPHLQAEDVFMISGDLHIGEEVLHAGDFHHAEAGTTHGINWSEHGCVLLAVLSKDTLLAQLT